MSQTSPLRTSRTAMPFHQMSRPFHDLFFLRGKKNYLIPKLIPKIYVNISCFGLYASITSRNWLHQPLYHPLYPLPFCLSASPSIPPLYSYTHSILLFPNHIYTTTMPPSHTTLRSKAHTLPYPIYNPISLFFPLTPNFSKESTCLTFFLTKHSLFNPMQLSCIKPSFSTIPASS